MENNQQKQDIRMPADLKPLYADEVSVNSNIKVNFEKTKDGKEIINKVGKVELLFLDQFTRSFISRMVIDPFTAKALGTMLLANADKLIKEIDDKTVPDEVKNRIEQQKAKQAQKHDDPVNTYIG